MGGPGDPVVGLRGICWDHPRCVRPMAAAARAWRTIRPEVEITWEARPLAAFNDQPIGELTERYDLVIFDHPMVGEIARTESLAPLDVLLPYACLDERARDSIGGSHESYRYAGHQWGLAIDAACQVAVSRADLLDELACDVPETWDDVLELARAHPGRVAIPLYPADALCSLLSIANLLGRPLEPLAGKGIELAAVELLVELAEVVAPESYALNPPALLDRMQSTRAYAYAPLVFGYVSYAVPGPTGTPALTFADAPKAEPGKGTPRGSILGGAGIGVSASSAHAAEAAEFAAWLSGPEAQAEVVRPNGGQPASAAVWRDRQADKAVGGFFGATATTLRNAWTRPREPWWRGFHETAGARLAADLEAHHPPRQILQALNQTMNHLVDRHRSQSQSPTTEGIRRASR